MRSIIDKTVGGLSSAYYVRQFLFGLIIPGVLIYAHRHTGGGKGIEPKEYGFFVNTLLYPYARYFYEKIAGYVVGNNIFISTPLALLFRKAVSMIVCWCLAVFMAPAGMFCLWYLHSRREREAGLQILNGLQTKTILKRD
ncbi:hypothetical protein [Enterobacter asburiae]|uniref:hypothetical protein n=1 Tax=Enterobacter asburiae TaxID=61645 RepID=UPI003F547C44